MRLMYTWLKYDACMRHGKAIKIGNWTEDNILQCLTQRGHIFILLQRSLSCILYATPLDSFQERKLSLATLGRLLCAQPRYTTTAQIASKIASSHTNCTSLTSPCESLCLVVILSPHVCFFDINNLLHRARWQVVCNYLNGKEAKKGNKVRL